MLHRKADNYAKVTEAIINYIQRTYTMGNDVKRALEEQRDFDFSVLIPIAPTVTMVPSTTMATEATPSAVLSSPELDVAKMILQSEVKHHIERKTKYSDNMHKTYALIIGQCTLGLRGKLERRKDWNTLKTPILLLQAIKEIIHNYQDNKYSISSIYRSIKSFINIKQEEKETPADFIKRFKNS